MQEKRAKLSVVLMTKNEEDKIGDCLEKIKWADEIVIVDDYSNDRTIDIARQYTDKIILHKSMDNHDRQWNIGIENATCEWILHIDADEVVPVALRKRIEEILLDSKGYDAFRLIRRNYFLRHWMKYGGWTTQSHLILFKKNSARCIGRGIHVKLDVKGKTGKIDTHIEHYPFKSIYQFIQRQNHYSSAEALEMLTEDSSNKIKELNYNLYIKPLKLFLKMFVKKRAYREGMLGFIFASLYAWVHFLKWAKYWEIVNNKRLV
ncbi:MAG: glycosyltransferase family 2 protein [Candidatus Omnitrophica bacterium]|nr:glycosyltransferase family 2 protein [Candidatus Omnitrophota bacterium]